jgi:hypothetical protein
MGGADEQHPTVSGGSGAERPYLQLTLLPSVEEQQEIIAEAEGEKLSAFSISQEDIDAELCSGSGVEHGKFRICLYFEEQHNADETVKFLKNEYGIGGHSPAYGRGISQNHDGKGIYLEKNRDKSSKITLSWNKAAKRIGELIAADRYLSAREKEQLPAYRQWDEERRARMAEEAAVREILRREPTQAPPEPAGAMRHTYHLGDTVYIGSDEYDVLAFDDDIVRLYDTSFPLFNKEMPRAEFDRRIRENPLNDHLREPAPPIPAAEKAASPRELYRAYLPILLNKFMQDEVVSVIRGSDDPVEAESELIRELSGLVESMEEGHPAFYEAFTSLPRFSDWMVDDLFERVYQDVLIDPRDSVEKYEHDPGAPEWAQTETAAQAPAAVREPEIPQEEPPFADNQHVETIGGVEHIVTTPAIRPRKQESGIHFPGEIVLVQVHIPRYTVKTLTRIAHITSDPPSYYDPENTAAYGVWDGKSGRYLKNDDGTYVAFDTYAEAAAHAEQLNATESALTPAWEKRKPKGRIQTFDPHPEIPQAQRRNFVITDDNLGHGGAKTKFHNNAAAIRTLRAVERDNRFATPEEQETLSRYVGWGGLPQAFDESNDSWSREYAELKELLSDSEYASARASTLNAHYTLKHNCLCAPKQQPPASHGCKTYRIQRSKNRDAIYQHTADIR